MGEVEVHGLAPDPSAWKQSRDIRKCGAPVDWISEDVIT